MCGKYQISSGYTIISETTIDIYMCSSLGGEKCHKYIAFPFCKSKTHLTVHFHFPLCMSKPHLYVTTSCVCQNLMCMSLLHVYVKTSCVCHYFMCMSNMLLRKCDMQSYNVIRMSRNTHAFLCSSIYTYSPLLLLFISSARAQSFFTTKILIANTQMK